MMLIMNIRNYIDDKLFPPKSNWTEYEFKKRSYERWAAFEILNDIFENSETDPYFVITSFRFKLDNMVNICKKHNHRLIFTVAIDIADEILTLL